MKQLRMLLLALSMATFTLAQEAQFYVDLDGNKQLCGPFTVDILEQDPAFKNWYEYSYTSFDFQVNYPEWTDFYRDVEVEIFLGSWCSDSQDWVPRFIKAWDMMGMDRSQLRLIALYGEMEDDSKYKKGPNGEEIGNSGFVNRCSNNVNPINH